MGSDHLFVIDRSARFLVAVAPTSRRAMASARLESGPDYVRFVRPTGEVWVTEPDAERIEVFSFEESPAPRLLHKTTIAVDGGPESLVIDGARGRAYTNLWKGQTVALELASKRRAATWPNGCMGSRGLALDEAAGRLYIGCAEGAVSALDVTSGRVVATAPAGRGVDIIAYNPGKHHLYVPGARSGTLTVFETSTEGVTPIATEAVPTGAHCAAADSSGAWVCDPDHGRVVHFTDDWEERTSVNPR